MKDKYHINILINAEKAFDEIESHFYNLKHSQQTRNRRNAPKHNKGHS